MMLASAAARLPFTLVFAAAALGAALPIARRVRPASQVTRGFCIAMCAALIAMSWWDEPAGVVWLQVAVFGGTALWLLLAEGIRTGLHHALMAAAMTWMLTAMPARAPMTSVAGTGGMPGMPGAEPSVSLLAISGLVATCCVATSIPWVTRAIGGRGQRLTDPGAASQAAMSIGMAAMLIAVL